MLMPVTSCMRISREAPTGKRWWRILLMTGGASLLIRMHEVTGMSIRDLRDLMGDRRTKYRLSDAQGRPKAEDRGDAQESNYAH